MLLYTVQKKEAVEELLLGGVVYPNDVIMEGSELAYGWMTKKMEELLGEEGRASKYPFWAFTELSSFAISKEELDSYMLFLEIPKDKVLLSDFIRWHEILNAGNWAEFDKTDLKVKKHWDRIIRRRNKKGAQACFWSITKEMVVKAVKLKDLKLKYSRTGRFYEVNLQKAPKEVKI